MPFKFLVMPLLSLVFVAVSGCSNSKHAIDAVPQDAGPETRALAEMKDALNNAVAEAVEAPPAETTVEFAGFGLSQVSTQPGSSLNQKRLMAIRAARMEALRDLTEQIHGIQLTSNTTLHQKVLRNDQINGVVAGEIRGAQTVSITPKGDDGYEVKMMLRPDTVRYIVRAARKAV